MIRRWFTIPSISPDQRGTQIFLDTELDFFPSRVARNTAVRGPHKHRSDVCLHLARRTELCPMISRSLNLPFLQWLWCYQNAVFDPLVEMSVASLDEKAVRPECAIPQQPVPLSWNRCNDLRRSRSKQGTGLGTRCRGCAVTRVGSCFVTSSSQFCFSVLHSVTSRMFSWNKFQISLS